jgi:glyoxylase-like metal-dependent hydrolase (beta-lactamase superfamily II)
MKRGLILAALILVGGLSIVATGSQTPAAQTPAQIAAAKAAQVAALKIEKVKDNLYMIIGPGADSKDFSGGNTAVFITDAGVVLVDTKVAGFGPTILSKVQSVTKKPVVTIINTHTHADHTGSNEFFTTAMDSVVQENTKALMAKMDEFKGPKAKFLPKRTFKDKLTLGSGKDQIDLYYFGPAHTSGDTFVVFPALRTMHVGDVFAWKAIPFVDDQNGGSVLAHPQTIAKAVATIKNVDTIINGHIPVSTWNDFKEYGDFSQAFVTWGESEMKAGKTVEQGAKEYKTPPQFKGYKVSINPDYGSPKANLQILYNELKKKK